MACRAALAAIERARARRARRTMTGYAARLGFLDAEPAPAEAVRATIVLLPSHSVRGVLIVRPVCRCSSGPYWACPAALQIPAALAELQLGAHWAMPCWTADRACSRIRAESSVRRCCQKDMPGALISPVTLRRRLCAGNATGECASCKYCKLKQHGAHAEAGHRPDTTHEEYPQQ